MAAVSPADLAEELHALDDEGVCEDWLPVAEEIITGVRECAKAGMIESLPDADPSAT